jgi:hypothetical protein
VFFDFLCPRANDHTLRCLGRAGGDWIADTLYLDNAESAGAEGFESFIVAESWNIALVTLGNFVDRLTFVKFDRFTIETHRENLR